MKSNSSDSGSRVLGVGEQRWQSPGSLRILFFRIVERAGGLGPVTRRERQIELIEQRTCMESASSGALSDCAKPKAAHQHPQRNPPKALLWPTEREDFDETSLLRAPKCLADTTAFMARTKHR